MNRIRKTEALVLRILPYSNTSHIVNWLSSEQGTVATVVKGALRPRSEFLGQYGLFYTCELLYYARERGGVHVAKSCAPLVERSGFRSNWRAYSAASYAAHLLLRVAQPGNPDHGLYRLANKFMDGVLRAPEPVEACLRFEWLFLSEAGFAPKVGRCVKCGRSPDQADAVSAKWTLLPESGVALCPSCPSADGSAQAQRIRRDSLLRMLRWGKEASFCAEPAVPSIDVSREELLEIGSALGKLVELHLHGEPAYRKLAYELSSVRAGRRAPAEKSQ